MRSLQYTLMASLFLAAGLSAIAFPPGRTASTHTQKALKDAEDFDTLKPGDEVGFVCLECMKMSTTKVGDMDDAMKMCKEGGEVVCPNCHKTYKIVRHGPMGRSGSTQREVVYVNDEGKECAFMTKIEEE